VPNSSLWATTLCRFPQPGSSPSGARGDRSSIAGRHGIFEPLGSITEYDYSVTYAKRRVGERLLREPLRLAVKDRRLMAATALCSRISTTAQSARVTTITDIFRRPPSVRVAYQHPPAGIDPKPQHCLSSIGTAARTSFPHLHKFGEPDPDTGIRFRPQSAITEDHRLGGTAASDSETGFGVTSASVSTICRRS